MNIQEIPTDKIKDQLITRTFSEAGIDKLISSIRTVGIIEPLIVAEHKGEYHLIAGKRRLTAASMIGLPSVPAVIIPADQETALKVALHENLFREDMSVVVEAQIYGYMRDKLYYSGKEIAAMLGKKEAYVSQRLAILEYDQETKEALDLEKIHFSITRELQQIDDPQHRKYLLHEAIRHGASYRTVQGWVQQWKASLIPKLTPTEPPTDTPAQDTRFVPHTTCFGCGQDLPVDLTKQILLCESCFKEMKKALG